MTKKKAKDCGVRVYGNQYGHWLEITDEKLASEVDAFCTSKGITHEQFLRNAMDWYIDKIEAKHFLELEHQERMKEKG